MEALFFLVDVALFIALLFAIRRNESSTKHDKLGWFSYIDDTRDVAARQEQRDA